MFIWKLILLYTPGWRKPRKPAKGFEIFLCKIFFCFSLMCVARVFPGGSVLKKNKNKKTPHRENTIDRLESRCYNPTIFRKDTWNRFFPSTSRGRWPCLQLYFKFLSSISMQQKISVLNHLWYFVSTALGG